MEINITTQGRTYHVSCTHMYTNVLYMKIILIFRNPWVTDPDPHHFDLVKQS